MARKKYVIFMAASVDHRRRPKSLLVPAPTASSYRMRMSPA